MTKNYFQNLERCLVIAEVGVNHNGDMSLAKKMIDKAKESGADAVKFQTFSAESLASINTPKVKYQEQTTSVSETHFQMLKKLELSKENHFILNEYCTNSGIKFLSTPYDIDSAEFLNCLNIEMFKTASADIVDLPLQKFLASTGKPVVVATGMASLGEIEYVTNIFQEASNENIVLLHCVSNYPCSDASINLKAMNTLKKAFQLPVGFSDHSKGSLAACLSVAFGAKVIEKHFTLDKSMEGPDHRASSSPKEFSDLVKNVRRAETILGSLKKHCQEEERQMASVSRKSIVLSKDCSRGTILEERHLVLRRPGTGILSHHLSGFIGAVLKSDLPAGAMLKWSDLQDIK